MPQPTEHKSVQSRILEYAGDIGWSFVSQREAETRRGFTSTSLSNPTVVAPTSLSNPTVVAPTSSSNPTVVAPTSLSNPTLVAATSLSNHEVVERSRNHRQESAKNASRFFTETLFEKVIQFKLLFDRGLSKAEALNQTLKIKEQPLSMAAEKL